jgi:hypothetical protein
VLVVTYDQEKVDEVVLALLTLSMFKDGPAFRAWKGHDWVTMDRLHEQGYISDPKSKTKSVCLSPKASGKGDQTERSPLVFRENSCLVETPNGRRSCGNQPHLPFSELPRLLLLQRPPGMLQSCVRE